MISLRRPMTPRGTRRSSSSNAPNFPGRLRASGGLAPLVAVPFLWPLVSRWAYDDPFITFRYAENLRAGLGFVYNPGEHVLSTTTPLYTVILAVLGRVWHDLPTLSNALGVATL